MKIKRWIGVLLCMLLCVGMLPTMAFAEELTVSIWDGSSVATAYESGDGTEANPYEIATAEQFAYFAEQIKAGAGADAYYILSSDLDMKAASWEPICGSLMSDYYNNNYFRGNFNGQGHCITYQISELSNVSEYSGVGLFGIAEGEISNLTVDGSISSVSGIVASWLGGICGLFGGNITNCASNVDITIQEGNSNASFFGGVTGEVQAGVMQNCIYSGRINLNFSAAYGDLYVGGLSGTVYAGKIDACKNEGDIAVKAANGSHGNAGGITGMVHTGGYPVASEIRDCYNEGAVTSTGNAGGIAGVVSAVLQSDQTGEATSGVYSCYSSAEIAGDVAAGAISPSLSQMDYTGGVNGSANAIVENCFYTVGTDENGTLSTDLEDLFQKLCEIFGEGVWVQDANGAPRLYWEFAVNLVPEAVFTATSDNSGTLSNVDASMKYSTDGGTTWNDITGETMEITGVTADNDVKVYQPGDGMDTLDSEIQTIDVTQVAMPTVSGVACTTIEQNDGQITGVDTTMEYRLDGDSGWTAITGNPVTGLTNGTYEVRVKASGTVLASTAATVAIGAHTCVAQGDWQYDGTGHWKLCACGAKVEEAAHSGGTATCMVPAVCEVCGQPYGEKNPNNHIGAEAWITTETTHTKVYSCCQAVIETETEHTWENGKCSVCQYDCTHQGGTATCSQLAQCELCGSLYGTYDESNHKAADTWTQENSKHYHICEYGCNTHLDEADCSGGTATCTAPAVCETCGHSYGTINPDNHTGEIVWTQTATTHSSAYDCCGAVVIAEEAHEWVNGVCSECGYECQHSGGEATCTEQAVCEICNEKYGALSAHKLSPTDKVEATCTTDGKEAYYTCEACGKYFEDEAGNTEITNLDEWGIIPAAGHKAGTEWKSDGTNHWNECVCGEKMNETAHDFEWVTDKEATSTEAGSRHEECKICGYKKAAVEIPATGTTTDPTKPNKPDDTGKPTGTTKPDGKTDSTSPQTGDNNNIALWIAVMLSAGAVLTGTAIYSRKRKYNR